MKKRYSTMVNTHKSDKPKKAFLQSNNTYMALFGSVLLSLYWSVLVAQKRFLNKAL